MFKNQFDLQLLHSKQKSV